MRTRSGRSRAPDPLHWLWYAVAGSLPTAYHEWVLYDLTCGTWMVRHLGRAVLQFSFWWLALLVPGPWSLRFSMVALGFLLSLYFSISFMEDACERRLLKAGYPAGLNRRIREETPIADRAATAALYASYYPPRQP
ncbi:DUF5313 family protein [Actinophytocola sp.]|uniref:DUF5313 family protein n=1 Tax=Actinophytocola sp. TaxID=1872138 RepID=UPI002D5976E3|nr:DUF5313 family protein [Actinophytocola sp.]HYQ70114.1 DUF5313 family protein [Actinophytocola sp.]